MELTQKFRIYPTKGQEDVQWILSEKCRLVYNFGLEHRNKTYEKTGASITYDQQQDDLPEIKAKYSEYKWVYSKVLQMVLKGLDADFYSFTSKRKKGDKTAQKPGYKGRDYFTTMIWNQSGFKIIDNKIILSHNYNKGKNYVPLIFDIPKDLIDNTGVCLQTIYDFDKIKQVTLFREEPHIKKDSEYYLSIVIDYPTSPLKDNGLYQAIDLGIGKIVTAVNMEAKFFEIENPRKDLYWNPIIDEIQSRRDHCKKEKVEDKVIDKDGNIIKDNKGKDKIIKVTKPSIKWIQFNNNKKKCQKKAHNQIKDDQHKWSNKMVKNTKSNTIIVGELNVKDMSRSGIKIEVEKKNEIQKVNREAINITKDTKKETIRIKSKKLNRSTQNQGYLSRFVGFLTYKAEKIGKRVIKISEVNTSKRCYACGKLHDMPLWNRTMKCDCGNVIDRDRNSAINIMINFLSKNALWTSYQIFVNNLKREGLLIPTWINIHSGF
jgi:putative transposase